MHFKNIYCFSTNIKKYIEHLKKYINSFRKIEKHLQDLKHF